MKQTITSNSPSQTEKIAIDIGEQLKGGELIELTSELGGGKTTFTHGLAKGIKSHDNVASPTFTISRIYNGDKLDIQHFDFYRLNEAGIIKHELKEVMANKKNVVVIEWPELLANILPDDSLRVEFIHLDENRRKISFTYPKNLSYLMDGHVNTSNQNR